MHIRLLKIWEDIRGSYWFVPGAMAVGAILLSLGTIALDGYFQANVLRNLSFIWRGGPAGARGILETVAGSMITVAGVTFSITMVALSFASSQFGSRLLRSFMADPRNQLVLGTFIATFIFCLLVLRTVRGGDGNDGGEFVPYLSVTTGMLLALVSLLVLIYFIHHMALSMQAPYLIGEVATDLLNSIDRLFPSETGSQAPASREHPAETDIPDEMDEQARSIHCAGNGYIQAIDEDELMRIASQNDLLIKMPNRPGHFMMEGDILACVWPGERIDKKVESMVKKSFILGKQRTLTQDVEFGIEQLVEVAERSLSPGINATFTALACIDWLAAALARLMKKGFPSPYRYDENGNMRIFFVRPLTLEGVIDTTFDQIRQSGRGNVAIRIRLLEKIAALTNETENEPTRQALERQARMIEHESEGDQAELDDQQDVMRRYQEVISNSRE
jgi:uncharacterized membrane protein